MNARDRLDRLQNMATLSELRSRVALARLADSSREHKSAQNATGTARQALTTIWLAWQGEMGNGARLDPGIASSWGHDINAHAVQVEICEREEEAAAQVNARARAQAQWAQARERCIRELACDAHASLVKEREEHVLAGFEDVTAYSSFAS